MSRRDKDKLIIIGSILLAVAFTVTMILKGSMIPWGVIAGIAVVAQCFVLVPMIAKDYYEVNQMRIGNVRFIPIVNEIQLFNPLMAKAACGGFAVMVLTFIASRLPLRIVGAVLQMKDTLAWGFNSVVVSVIVMVIVNFIFAFGLCGVFRNVNLMVLDCVGEKTSVWEVAFYILLMIPILRVCSLASLQLKVRSLIQFGYGIQEKEEFVEES